MTKRYTGNPPNTVTVDGVDLVPGAEFMWGDAGPGARLLAFALLMDALGNEIEAKKYQTRFLHRRVKDWKATDPWTITDAEIVAVVNDMKDIENNSANMRRQIAAEGPTVGMEGGLGVAGRKIIFEERKG